MESYEPGQSVQFRFAGPRMIGFSGFHRFEVERVEEGKTKLRHVLEVRVWGIYLLLWPLVVRPGHNACVENALDRAEASTGAQPAERPDEGPCFSQIIFHIQAF